MSNDQNERVLVFLLRLGAVLTGSAFLAMFLSEATMASIHENLGLGEFPASPLTNYLTRSLSAMYAFHGAVLLALSMNVRRFQPVVRFLGWATAVLGLAILAIDLQAPMPAWWVFAEGPWVILIGFAIVWLSSRLEPWPS